MLKKFALLSFAGVAILGAPLAPASAAVQGTPECDAEATAYANARTSPNNMGQWQDYFYFYEDTHCTAP